MLEELYIAEIFLRGNTSCILRVHSYYVVRAECFFQIFIHFTFDLLNYYTTKMTNLTMKKA